MTVEEAGRKGGRKLRDQYGKEYFRGSRRGERLKDMFPHTRLSMPRSRKHGKKTAV